MKRINPNILLWAVLTCFPLSSKAQGITIESGGNVVATGNATIEISNGSFVNNGTYTKGTETLTLTGTTNQSLGGSVNPNVNNLIVGSTGVVSVQNNLSVATLRVEPTSKLTVATGKTLTVTNLDLKGNTSSTATLVNSGTCVVTNSTVEQYLTGGGGATPNTRFWYLSSPLKDANTSAFDLSSSNPVNKLWLYSEPSHAYTQITTSQSMTKGGGYVTRLGANKTIVFSGSEPFTGDVSIPITRASDSNTKRGYNLIGNPYPSYVTIDPTDNPDLETSIWFRSMLSNGLGMVFDTYNLLTHASVVNSGSGLLNEYIPPMQAFWVRATNTGTTNVVLKNANRSHQSSIKLRSEKQSADQALRLQLTNGLATDETFIGFYEQAQVTFDQFDSRKMESENVNVPEICTYAGGEKVAINGLPLLQSQMEIPLDVCTGSVNPCTIKVTEMLHLDEDVHVFLTDKWKGIRVDLTESPQYEFTSTTIWTENRFLLQFIKIPTLNTAPISKRMFDVLADENGTIQLYFDASKKIDAQIRIFTMSGKLLITQDHYTASGSIETKLPKGYYLIEARSADFCERKIVGIVK